MTDFNYITFGNTENPTKLIVFLHGYNSYIKDIVPFANIFANSMKDTLVIVPDAHLQSEKNPLKKQWYALVDLDPELIRRNPDSSIEQIVDIYNKTGDRISGVAKKVNSFISNIQKKYAIANKDTYLMGFSQGAMLAIYTGLTRRFKLGGVFSLAGIICGKDMLEKELLSKPNVYLFHGSSDKCVQYKTLDFTKSWLDKHDIFWEAIEYDGIEHKVIEEEIFDSIEIINRSA